MISLSISEEKAFRRIEELYAPLSTTQREQLCALNQLYQSWNSKINLISRKDIDNLYLHHILHSVGIGKLLRFRKATRVIDVGSGGGFPGIPLAILHPEATFMLVDSTAKKLKASQAIADAIGLENVSTHHSRIEEFTQSCHFAVSRATMPLVELEKALRRLILSDSFNAIPNGIIALKGGNLASEIAPFSKSIVVEELQSYLQDDYYLEKSVLYLPVRTNKKK